MPSPAAREVANTNGRNSTGFLNATASVTIPAAAVQVGDLLIVTISADSGDANNWGELSGSGWTRFLYVDRGAGQPKLKGWWKLNTTTASQTYSATMTGAAWAQVSYWQAWQAGTFNPDFPIGGAIGHVSSKSQPYPSTASTMYAAPAGTGDRVLQTVFSLFNNPSNSPSWVNRPAPWNQTVNRESGGNYHSQYGAWRYITPGSSDQTVAAVDFPVSDAVVRPYVNATYYIHAPAPVDARTGTGWAAGVGVSARASGAATRKGAPSARLGFRVSAAGSKRSQGAGQARSGMSARAAGPKSTTGTAQSAAVALAARGAGLKRAHGIGQAPRIGLGAYGTTPPPVPVFTGRPLPEDPLPLASSRYLVQNILTGEWLHTDLPLSDDQVTLTLSGPCQIAGKLTPETADLKAPDGSPLLRSWGHVVYLEMDGEIRAAGLITEDSYDDQTQTLACQGVSAYPSVITYLDTYTRYNIDPLQVAQEMWGYVQSFQNGNLGVTLERLGDSGVRLGTEPKQAPSQPRGYLTDGSDPDPAMVAVWRKSTAPAVWQRLLSLGYQMRDIQAEDGSYVWGGFYGPDREVLYVKPEVLDKAKTDVAQGRVLNSADTEIEPFKVAWWDVKTVGSVIDEVVKACPADYVEQYRWNNPRTFVYQSVLVAYPRVGRRRDDLRFVQGENIVQPVALDGDPDAYATCVVGIGAGEGSEAIRETAEVITPGRLRKTHTYRNSKITDRTVLRRIVAEELTRRSVVGVSITTIVVKASHVNAPFGAYNVGDDIPIEGVVPHYGRITQWGRITSMTLARGADLVQITVRRSDSFRYGREVETS